MKLRPMSEAPHDGTPIVAIFPIIDEGDFIMVAFWIEDDGGYWSNVVCDPYQEDFFLGWIGTAEEVFTEMTGLEA